MSNVAGIFSTKSEAENAYALLLREGFSKENISFLISEEANRSFFKNQAPTTQLVDEGVGGAAAGAAFGAILAGLTVVGTLFVPGISLMAVGPLAAALVGAEAGAVVGGLSGLINADLDNEKDVYEKALKQGKAVLIVHTPTIERKVRAQAVLDSVSAFRKVA